MFIYPSPDLSAEDEIVQKIAEMSVKLQHIDTLNDQRKLDLQGISVQFSSLLKLVKDHQDQFEDNNSLLNKRLAEYSKQGDYRLTSNQWLVISSTFQWNY